jgi:hypothetical protein
MKNSVLLLIAFCALLSADTLLVPSEYPSIQSAISASQDGDTVLVSPGEYGGPIGFQGKNIVVMSTSGPENTLIRTFMDFHCVSFTGGEDSTAVLQGFTLRNQISDGAVSGKQEIVDHGGGVYIYESSPTVSNCIMNDCVAGMGAGVYINYSSARLIDCTISNNWACGYLKRGGGIYAGRSDSNGPPSIINCDIYSNEAQYGGGIQVEASFVKIINNNIHDNYSDHESGGINVWGSGPEILSNSIVGNDGGKGGGILVDGTTATLIGNLIAENTAGLGGGVACDPAYLLMENNTICMNTALSDPYGTGGLRITQCDTAFVTNNIIWGNQAPNGTVPNILIYDTYITISYSNIGGGLDSLWIDSTSTLIWGSGNIDIDPQFETGPFGDYHLSYGSPCIDAGNPAWEYNDPEDPFNLGYALWPAMGLIRNDMGAFGGGAVNYWLIVEEEELSPPEAGLVLKSFPNPFSSFCTVCYQLDEASHVVLSVFDLSGRLVETLVDEVVPAGMYSEYLDGTGLCSGMYLIRLVADDLSTSRRCIIIRDN